jgi:O-antigen ligase
MESLKQAGEQVEGVDTGTSRLVIINAQWQMFQKWPMGCGHRCTATLSSQYMEDRYLTGPPGNRSRSSHNTFMSLLVEQGVIGALMYFSLALWAGFKVFSVARLVKNTQGELPAYFAAISGVVVITIVGDLFVDYLKLEVRIWFVALLLIVARMAREQSTAAKPVGSAVAAKRGAAANIPIAQPSGTPRSHGMPRR